MANASINETTTSQKPSTKNATKVASESGDTGRSTENGKWISKESYTALMDRGSDMISRANTSATGIVRDYPIQAAVGGLVVGFVLGSLFSRRSSAV